MTKKHRCEYCDKEIAEESDDADEITYIIDPDDRKIVCFECLHHNQHLHYPRVVFHPGGEEVWVSENFTGTYDFNAKWVSVHKYRGQWELSSNVYEKMDSDDVESDIAKLEERGVEFAIVDNNAGLEVWIKKK